MRYYVNTENSTGRGIWKDQPAEDIRVVRVSYHRDAAGRRVNPTLVVHEVGRRRGSVATYRVLAIDSVAPYRDHMPHIVEVEAHEITSFPASVAVQRADGAGLRRLWKLVDKEES